MSWLAIAMVFWVVVRGGAEILDQVTGWLAEEKAKAKRVGKGI